jgi:hypothetical protein
MPITPFDKVRVTGLIVMLSLSKHVVLAAWRSAFCALRELVRAD